MTVVTCEFKVTYPTGEEVTVPQQVRSEEIPMLVKHYLQSEKAVQVAAYVNGEFVAMAI